MPPEDTGIAMLKRTLAGLQAYIAEKALHVATLEIENKALREKLNSKFIRDSQDLPVDWFEA